MRNFEELRKQSFEINKPDFYRAMNERNFEEMSDIYNEMMRYDDLGATYGMNKHIFTEVLDGYIIKLPINTLDVIHNIGKDFYYILSNDYIVYTTDKYHIEDGTTDITYDYLKKENVEADKGEFTGDTITFTSTAVKTLNLSVGDIIDITLDDDGFELSKFERPLIFD